MIVVITAAAEADLEVIGDWIEQDNPARARTFVHELRQSCEGLAHAPRGYSLIPQYQRTGIRRRPYPRLFDLLSKAGNDFRAEIGAVLCQAEIAVEDSRFGRGHGRFGHGDVPGMTRTQRVAGFRIAANLGARPGNLAVF